MPTKEPVTVRYSRDVLEYFRSTGPGWQARIDAVLKEWVAQHCQGHESTFLNAMNPKSGEEDLANPSGPNLAL